MLWMRVFQWMTKNPSIKYNQSDKSAYSHPWNFEQKWKVLHTSLIRNGYFGMLLSRWFTLPKKWPIHINWPTHLYTVNPGRMHSYHQVSQPKMITVIPGCTETFFVPPLQFPWKPLIKHFWKPLFVLSILLQVLNYLFLHGQKHRIPHLQ